VGTPRAVYLEIVTLLNSQLSGTSFGVDLARSGRVYCYLERFPLMAGRYFCDFTVRANGALEDRIETAFSLDVQPGDYYGSGHFREVHEHGVFVSQTWLARLD